MKGVVWDGKAAVATEVETPSALPDSVWVEPAYVGLCGTDVHLIDGHHPRAVPGVVLGHEFSGRLRLDEPLDGWRDGDPVFVNPWVTCRTCVMCRQDLENHCENFRVIGIDLPGSMTSRVSVPVRNLVRLPDNVSLMIASLVEPVATAVRAVKRAGIRGGEVVQIIGFGPIGFFVAAVARREGASRILVSERSAERAKLASKMGYEVVDGRGTPVDVVFDCVGSGTIPETLTSWVKPYGTVMIVGLYPTGLQGFNVHDAMIRELTVRGTKAYTHADIQEAVEFLSADPSGMGAVISDVVGLDAVGRTIDTLREGGGMKVLVDAAK